jgi:excisionase family DNA binding protein
MRVFSHPPPLLPVPELSREIGANAHPFRTFDDDVRMNKREVADELGCSTRQVEKYVGQKRLRVVEYVRGKSGREGVYDPEEVARLKVELDREQKEVVGYAPPPTALAAPKQAQSVALVEHLTASLDRQHADAERIIKAISALKDSAAPAQLDGYAAPGVAISDKLVLSLKEVAQLTGCSVAKLREDCESGRLKAKKNEIARGWRVKRDDLTAFVEKL